MTQITNYGKLGFIQDGESVYTFQIGNATTDPSISLDSFPQLQTPPVLNFAGYKVYLMGNNNNLPNEIKGMIGGNRVLPQLIEKQVTALFGQGPMTYRLEFEDRKPVRNWEPNEIIQDWLDGWKGAGMRDDYMEFANKVIREYYHMESYWVKWRTTKARQIDGPIPIAGLEFMSNKRVRFATKKKVDIFADDLEERDFEFAMVGNWFNANEKKFKEYAVLDFSDPLKAATSISYHKNPSFGEEVYAYNSFYKGIKEWIIGSNLTPKYINTFLHYSLSAKLHIVIPDKWVENKRNLIKEYCEINKERKDAGTELLKPNDVEIGTEYNEYLLTQYITAELKKITAYLSGASNQGKAYYSYSFGDGDAEQKIRFEEIPMKYKEYIDSLTAYDKRADEVILAAKGLDASISNISKDGVISKSGADVFYNYIIYLHNLPWAEYVCTQPLNLALKINFPNLYKQGYRIGFYNPAPVRQEDTPPDQRLQNTKE
ncbi:MAG: hypothetical protein J7L96_04190 [Bacteroidales bacterium]|nr:hypothetical protein [Bacteroidales bacterium]